MPGRMHMHRGRPWIQSWARAGKHVMVVEHARVGERAGEIKNAMCECMQVTYAVRACRAMCEYKSQVYMMVEAHLGC